MRVFLMVAVAICLLSPAVAFALDGSMVLLGFGASYPAGDGTRVHRGTDVALPSGSQVDSPVDGTVAFAGRVPSPDGGTVLALTLDSAQGRVTLLPFEDIGVEQGATVNEGQAVGTVAAQGDPSSPGVHVHVGLRSGDLYLDPAVLLTTVAVQEPAEEPAADVPAGEPTLARGAASPVQVASGVSIPVPDGASAPEPLTQTPAVQADGAAQTGTSPVLQPGVSLVPVVQQAGDPVAARQPGGVSLLTLSRARSVMRELAANTWGLASIVCALGVMGFIFTRRFVERSACSRPTVSHRWGKMLQHLRAGDTLCGLISCSGHDAFTVPGPPAQRR